MLTPTLEPTPADATHSSTRSMAHASGLSRSAVHRIWRAFALQPHPVETLKLSADPLFIEKVRDIVGLYLQPPIAPGAVCRREEPDPGARSDPAALADAAGPSGAADPRLPRHGTPSVFAALDTQTGTVIEQLHRRHRSIEFRKFLDAIDVAIPADLAVHLIMDNYGTHRTALVRRWLANAPASMCTSRRPAPHG